MSRFNFEDFDPAQFVKEIRTFMAQNNLSTRQFAALTESSPSTLYRIESGKTDLTVETGKKFQKFMRTYRGA